MFRNKYILIRNLALLCFLGNLLYWLFPFPPFVWRVAMVLLSLYVILFEEGKRLPVEKAVLFFAFFNLIHFFVSFLWQTPSTTQIGNILYALLPLSMFTCLSQKGVMSDKFFSFTAIVLLVAAVFHYYQAERIALIQMAADDGTDITNNASVAFLMLLPMLLLVKNNIQKWVSLMICLFYLLMSAKRGNIIAAVIPTGLLIYSVLKDSRRSVLKTILVLVVIVVGALMVNHWVESNEYLLSRIEQTEEGNSSGRDAIYKGAWHVWYDSSSLKAHLFGYGFDGILQKAQTDYKHAHNDWLECLVNYGLLGVLFYLVVFVLLIVQIIKVKSFHIKIVLLSSFFIWFFKTMFSMGFTDESLAIMMISMGTAMGNYKSQEKLS